jgi:nucleoside-diphosphate-sugar epimerase
MPTSSSTISGRVVLTGAAGRLGRVLLTTLRAAKFDVLATDMAPWPDCPVPFVRADLCDAEATNELLKGCAAVVHGGAVPGPSATTPPGVDPAWSGKQRIGLEQLSPAQLLARNVSSAWNVFEGAARAGATRVVFSSSMFAMGWSHDPRGYQPRYLPLDEAHPPLPMESYGLSKVLGEEAAATVARISRRTARPMTIASLRFTNLVYPENEDTLPWAAPTDEAPANLLMWHWSKAHEVAAAHLLALQAPSIGPEAHEAFLLCAPTTRFTGSSVALAKQFYPDVAMTRAPAGPVNRALIDAGKAERILGWKPTTVDALRIGAARA